MWAISAIELRLISVLFFLDFPIRTTRTIPTKSAKILIGESVDERRTISSIVKLQRPAEALTRRHTTRRPEICDVLIK